MNLTLKLAAGEFVFAPGVYDPLSALLADQMGFSALYLTGYGVNAGLLGKPDAGFVSYHEMVDRIRTITELIDAPLIADGDTGFGGLANVSLAVRGFEKAGAAAIQLEDQEFPKRCGHTKNRRVIDTRDMVDKLQVACESREDPSFLLIARTDARTELGLDEALRRADAYLAAGADALFIESPESIDEMRIICDRFKGVPLVANMVGGGRTPLLDNESLASLGFKLVIHPIYLLGAAVKGMREAATMLSSTGRQSTDVADIHQLNSLLGFEEIWALDERYRRN